jgi:ubiquinone/menaquinone biosynthesis C-methylase UbiE
MHERRFPISQVQKLEDPERRKWLPPDEVVRLLDIHADWTIADIGYFTLPMARIAAKVLAVDVEPGMLARIEARLIETELNNVVSLQGEASATGLAGSCCDCILMANVWHEFDDHAAVLAEAARILKPNGVAACCGRGRRIHASRYR